MFQIFHLFQMNVASVLSGCCKKVDMNIAYTCMLQLLYLNVSKVDQVLHMGCAWEVVGGTDDVWGGMGDVRRGGTTGVSEPDGRSLAPCTGSVQTLAHGSDVRVLAYPYEGYSSTYVGWHNDTPRAHLVDSNARAWRENHYYNQTINNTI
jgi:hypothetical protein